MSDFDDSDFDEDRIFRLEAGLIWSTTRLRVLEIEMTSVLETLGLKNSSGQTFADLVHKQTDSALRDLLRHYADDDPDFAARLSRYFDEMKKKDVPPVA
jgi:hypothetical protein